MRSKRTTSNLSKAKWQMRGWSMRPLWAWKQRIWSRIGLELLWCRSQTLSMLKNRASYTSYRMVRKMHWAHRLIQIVPNWWRRLKLGVRCLFPQYSSSPAICKKKSWPGWLIRPLAARPREASNRWTQGTSKWILSVARTNPEREVTAKTRTEPSNMLKAIQARSKNQEWVESRRLRKTEMTCQWRISDLRKKRKSIWILTSRGSRSSLFRR